MVGFLDAAAAAVRRSYCAATERLGVYGEIYLGGDNPVGAAAIGAANFLHNAACDRPPPPATTPPFSGGQCAVLYNVNAVMTRNSGSIQNPFNVSGQAYGPIQGVRFRNSPGNQTTLEIIGAPFGSNTTGIYGLGGVATNFGTSETDVNGITITSVSRADGQPDTCGNPPGTRPTPSAGSGEVADNITYINNEGTEITVPVVIALGYAKIDIDGSLNIPFTLNANADVDFNISGNFNLNTGDVEYDSGNPSLPGSPCRPNSDDIGADPDDDIPDNPIGPDIPDPIPDPEKPQTRKLMVGCLVTVTQVPPQVTVIPQGSNPDVYAPDVGLVNFQISVGGVTGWTEDFRVKNARQIIPCPWEGGAIGVSGTPRTNGAMTITPLYEKRTLGQTYLP